MPQPQPYSRTFSFTEDEAAHPSEHVPGISLDSEFDGVAATVAGILANLLKLQRDDGALKNGVVTIDSLSPATLVALGSNGWTPRGVWAAATHYEIGSVVTSGTGTYVGAVDHVSAATFAGEAAGAWIKLFDSAGLVPDGSITADKLAPGAVGDAAIGFTALDLPGSVRGQGGLSAGTAPAGALFHAKLDAGDVYGKAERNTDAQGVVGYQIVGVGATWALEMAAGSNRLSLKQGATVRATFDDTGFAEFTGAVRATGGDPATGVGVHMSYSASVGYVSARNYSTNAWQDLKVRGLNVYLTAAGVDIAKVTSTGMDILAGKTLTLNGSALGYLGIPQITKSTAYTLSLTDVGSGVYSKNTAAQTITVPPKNGTTANWTNDSAILIINDGTSNITLTQGAGGTPAVAIRLAGSASVGNRTIAAGGMCFLKCVDAANNRWFASGPGTS